MLNIVNICLYTGAIGMLWGIAWWFVSSEKPATHPKISEDEKYYIESTIAENTSSSVSNKV